MPDVISDTSPLQYLFQTGHLDLLPNLYGTVLVPRAVADELAVGRALGIPLPDPNGLPWVQICAAKESDLLTLVPDLGSGERASLALALNTPGSILILDDLLARRYADFLKLRYTGTLGVLLRAKIAGHIAIIRPVLDELDRLRLRLSGDTRAAVLRRAGE